MKAAVLTHINQPLTLSEVELGNLTSGHVLVKILVSGICGAQLQEISGNKGNAAFVPHLLGHEACGIVEDIAPDVTTVKKGDKVVMHWRKGDGIEADFPVYILDGKAMPSGKVTTFSEYSIVSENRVTAVPLETPNDFCALLGCGLSTALGTIIHEARVMPGQSVMVVGFGGLGASLVKAAQIAKAGTIIVVDVHENKREQVAVMGVEHFVDASNTNISKYLQEIGLKGVDVIIETSGNVKSIENTLPLLAGSGTYVLVGQPVPGESVELRNANHLFGGEGKTIKATQGGKFSPATDIPTYIQMYNDGLLDIEHLITHRISLENINDGIELMRSGRANRIMIDIWK